MGLHAHSRSSAAQAPDPLPPACSFLLGFHVHEKAILMALIPLALNAADGTWAAGEYMFAAMVSTYSLFPLLYTPAEYPIKACPELGKTMAACLRARTGCRFCSAAICCLGCVDVGCCCARGAGLSGLHAPTGQRNSMVPNHARGQA